MDEEEDDDDIPVSTPHASSKGGSQNFGRTEVKINCDGCSSVLSSTFHQGGDTYDQE